MGTISNLFSYLAEFVINKVSLIVLNKFISKVILECMHINIYIIFYEVLLHYVSRNAYDKYNELLSKVSQNSKQMKNISLRQPLRWLVCLDASRRVR
jgi:hypothetical protein